MKAKQDRSKPNARSMPRDSAHTSKPGNKSLPRWGLPTLFVIFVTLCATAGVWVAMKLSKARESAKEWADAQRSNIPSMIAKTNLTRDAKRAEKEDPEFVRKMARGNELLAQGNAAGAVEVFTEAAGVNPEDEDVHYNLGVAYARQGKLDEAMQQYYEALRIYPKYVEVHNNLGNVLMRLDRKEQAIEHFETAVKIMPDYAAAHNNLGTALQKVGRTNEALAHFQQAVSINPGYWEAHFNVATSALQSSRLDDAKSEFEKVLALKPDFQPARAGLAEVETRQASGAVPGR